MMPPAMVQAQPDGVYRRKEIKMNWNEIFSYEKSTGFLYWKSKSSVYSRIAIGSKAGYLNKSGYLIVTVNFKKLSVHRIVWEMHNDKIQDGMCIDHINGNKKDNRLENLRLATMSQNVCNQSLGKRNKSGFKGVCKPKNQSSWVAQICINKNITHLGYFDTKEEAYAARVAAEKEYHGDFAQSLCRSS